MLEFLILFGDDMKEIWKDLMNFEGAYKISNYGNIKSLPRISTNIIGKRGGTKVIKEKIIANTLNKTGYVYCHLSFNGKNTVSMVHTLVANNFLIKPESTESLQVNHKDGDKQNNRVDNLEWVTSKENIHHSIRTGLRKSHHQYNPNAKLTLENVKEIKELISMGILTAIEIGKMYGVNSGCIAKIKYGRTWKDEIKTY